MRFAYSARTAALAAAIAALPILASPLQAADVTAGDLVIAQPWARATPGGASVAGGYLTVRNRGATADRLVGGTLEAADRFEFHTMTSDNGIMRMRPAGPLTIPPGGILTLAPSGTHIMFTGLKHGLKAGESVKGSLTFEHAGTVPVIFDVGAIAATAAPGHRGSPDAGMPGMKME